MRPHLFISLLLLASAPVLFAACAADIEESCVGGDCKFDGYVAPDVSGGGPPMGAAACPPGPATGDLPCEVFDVLQRRCHKCHQDPTMSGAPFPLYKYEDTQQPYGKDPVFKAMAQVIAPNAALPMPLGGPPLSPEDAKTLGDWLNSCAPPLPEGMGCQCPAPGMGCMPMP